jgi:hypothetical protein
MMRPDLPLLLGRRQALVKTRHHRVRGKCFSEHPDLVLVPARELCPANPIAKLRAATSAIEPPTWQVGVW